jgi:membrane fusion protein, multidrug efflux system
MKIKHKGRWIAVIIGLAFAAAVGGVVAKKIQERKADEAKREAEKKLPKILALAATDLYALEMKPVSQTLTLTGTLEPMAQGVAKARALGTLLGATKREGDSVRAGEVLGQVDSADLRMRVSQQESLRAQAQAQLDVASKNRQAQKGLFDKGFISKTAFDNTEGSFLGAQAAANAAQAQLNMASQALRDTTIVAPMAGVVSRRHVEPGERVSNEMTVYTIMHIDSLEFAPQVPAEEAAKLSVGRAVEVSVPGIDKPYAATITRIAPTASAGTRTVDVRAKLPNSDRALKAGVSAIGAVALSAPAPALVAPMDAIRAADSAPHVYAFVGDKVVRQDVKLGARDERSGTIVIASGAKAGDRVLSARVQDIKDGQAANIAVAPTVAPAAATTEAPKK